MGGRSLQVGLTGGIGSGKSEVARLLVEHGAVLVDSDVLAREVIAPGTPGLAAVVARFGDGVLRADGALDRAALASLVFTDPDARADLEAIVHPRVAARAAELAASVPPGSVVVHDVPLLVEAGLAARYDLVVVVDVPLETQLSRLVSLRGMSEEDARARIAAQAGRDRRLAAADIVIDNSGQLADLRDRVAEVWRRLRAEAARTRHGRREPRPPGLPG